MRLVTTAVAIAALAPAFAAELRAQEPAPTPTPPVALPVSLPSDFTADLREGTPEEVGISSDGLCALTDWLQAQRFPIFSLLISRRGRLVYELYAPGVDREQAHYLMSVTKSVLALLVGIAMTDGLLPAPEAKLVKALPRELFGDDTNLARFRDCTIRDVLCMSVLDARLPPDDTSDAAVARQSAFLAAPNRVRFALTQELLPPGTFQYNNLTPLLAVGLLQYAARATAFEFAQTRLFAPLGVRHAEWLSQDAAGIDSGGHGLRLRPIDMQKLGVLLLRNGKWNGKQLVAKQQVERVLTPQIRSRADVVEPDYGNYWWTKRPAPGWTVHEANGWKGQRLAVVPDQQLVVTMTACFEDVGEHAAFDRLLTEQLRSAVKTGDATALPRNPKAQTRLRRRLQEPATLPSLRDDLGAFIVPATAAKATRVSFDPAK
jgi:CubicO group peptidase (beta-lactamase class C family)